VYRTRVGRQEDRRSRLSLILGGGAGEIEAPPFQGNAEEVRYRVHIMPYTVILDRIVDITARDEVKCLLGRDACVKRLSRLQSVPRSESSLFKERRRRAQDFVLWQTSRLVD
jgi:hypothetical protein